MKNSPNKIFDADYFLRGIETKKSNYQNYHWMSEKTILLAKHLIYFLDIKKGDKILDYGCAKGFLVKAFRILGFKAWGYDISEWAISNCDDTVKYYVSNDFTSIYKHYDFVIAKDVLEHLSIEELKVIIPSILKRIKKVFFIIVPLTEKTNGKYLCNIDEQDSTHIIRWTIIDWFEFLRKIIPKDFVITFSYQLPVMKPNCYEYPLAYGFIKIERYNLI